MGEDELADVAIPDAGGRGVAAFLAAAAASRGLPFGQLRRRKRKEEQCVTSLTLRIFISRPKMNITFIVLMVYSGKMSSLLRATEKSPNFLASESMPRSSLEAAVSRVTMMVTLKRGRVDVKCLVMSKCGQIITCCSQIIFHVADEQKGDSPSCTMKLFGIAHPSRYCGERRLAQSEREGCDSCCQDIFALHYTHQST